MVQNSAQSRHNLQSISTINSNLNQVPDSAAQLTNFRTEPNSRAIAYGADNRAGTSVPGKRNNINLEAVQAYYNTNESQGQLGDRAPKSPNIDGI